MTLAELEQKVPALREYTRNMPEDIRSRCTVRTHKAGSIIHQKDEILTHFGIVAIGENRVINEFENGNVYMIEGNHAIDFIGEVTLLAGQPRTSVTIEALTDNIVAYISREDAEQWISLDMNILRLASAHTAFKLYRSSYHNGAKLFYPPGYLLLDYLVNCGGEQQIKPGSWVAIQRTRQMLQEELGINVKTLNRTIAQLKSEGFFNIQKGKIIFNYEQYLNMQNWLKFSGQDS
ncbi:MAG: Crp/Fnr family transcriptional regulator [Oscillospiraceae bacterium]|jgi:CRP/FNR family cyclic AMP-dependent transcriptional regulator|nr:Crp/Fnr family transcriptional regulator [Oscillospiraceae bacterium]MCI9364526.1 Crp/Fnr family transcriptional regulator [Oscillospiraceae bacterium]MCI9668661.1 Crp/Fnr family transcriptional regulator [Oscillospiraceae bacterium]